MGGGHQASRRHELAAPYPSGPDREAEAPPVPRPESAQASDHQLQKAMLSAMMEGDDPNAEGGWVNPDGHQANGEQASAPLTGIKFSLA